MLKNRTSIAKNDGVNPFLLAIIVLLMTAGAAAGSIYSSKISGQEEWIINYLANTGTEAFKNAVLLDVVLVGIIFLSGFASIGLILIAAAVAAKGFIGSCTVTACVKLLGLKGYIMAFQTGFISLIFTTFAVVFISLQSAQNAGRRIKGENASREDGGDYFTSFMIAVALTVFGGAVDAFLIK